MTIVFPPTAINNIKPNAELQTACAGCDIAHGGVPPLTATVVAVASLPPGATCSQDILPTSG